MNIGHPSVSWLLSEYPDRAVARRKLTEYIVEEARRVAASAGLSDMCRYGNHRRVVHEERERGGRSSQLVGCANEGSGCICQCHDPADVS